MAPDDSFLRMKDFDFCQGKIVIILHAHMFILMISLKRKNTAFIVLPDYQRSDTAVVISL